MLLLVALAVSLALDVIDCEGVCEEVAPALTVPVSEGDCDVDESWLAVPDELGLPDCEGVADELPLPLKEADCERDCVEVGRWLAVPDTLGLSDCDGVDDALPLPLNDDDCDADSVGDGLAVPDSEAAWVPSGLGEAVRVGVLVSSALASDEVAEAVRASV